MKNETTQSPAELVLPSADLAADIAFFTAVGFRLDQILPADNPQIARLSGHGLHLCIDCNAECPPATIRLPIDAAPEGSRDSLTAPNGCTLLFGEQTRTLPTLANYPFEIRRLADATDQVTGRAGMLYRDLSPSRFGGKIIASHISIPLGGPVNDMVHYHEIEFQLIYCYKGWVKVVYEDQGEPMILEPGDCVTQPPGIRHRVLESSDHLEVIEIGVPAMHMTNIDHELELPTGDILPEKEFGGQTFCHHIANEVPWLAEVGALFQSRETDVESASRGVARVKALRPNEAYSSSQKKSEKPAWCKQQDDLTFFFVMEGELTLHTLGKEEETTTNQLVRCDAVTLPRGQQYRFAECSSDLMLLEVTLVSRAA